MATWKVTDPTCVTDNAANEKKAIEILGWERSSCYRHCINLIVKNAFEDTEVNTKYYLNVENKLDFFTNHLLGTN